MIILSCVECIYHFKLLFKKKKGQLFEISTKFLTCSQMLQTIITLGHCKNICKTRNSETGLYKLKGFVLIQYMLQSLKSVFPGVATTGSNEGEAGFLQNIQISVVEGI